MRCQNCGENVKREPLTKEEQAIAALQGCMKGIRSNRRNQRMLHELNVTYSTSTPELSRHLSDATESALLALPIVLMDAITVLQPERLAALLRV